jgi:hypothetical protein
MMQTTQVSMLQKGRHSNLIVTTCTLALLEGLYIQNFFFQLPNSSKATNTKALSTTDMLQ